MDYSFEVRDFVITSTGQVGIIDSICNCSKCHKRGFFEPRIITLMGTEPIYITDLDKETNFENFFKIGNYICGNVDREAVVHDIEITERAIKIEENRLDALKTQLAMTDEMENYNKQKGMENIDD